MRRILLGILALSFLMAAVGIHFRGLADDYTPVLSFCIRMGLVLGALWLAFHQVDEFFRRTPPWVIGGALFCMLVIVVRPRAILAIAPLLAGIAVLRYFGQLLKAPLDSNEQTKPPRPPDERPP